MTPDCNDFHRLTWTQRIGYGAGDLAQNLIYQTICTYLLFFYTDVYKLGGDATRSAALAGTMFLIVRLIDMLWSPVVGVFVDRRSPRLGKYRSYLLTAGLPMTVLAILCFWDGMAPSLPYAYATYVGLSLLYTLVNIPYGALNSSLTRDNDEVTLLTSVRIIQANIGGVAVMAGVPLTVALFAGKPLPYEMALYMGLSSLPALILLPALPVFKRWLGKRRLFYVALSTALAGSTALYIISRLGRIDDHIGLVYAAQLVKSAGLIIAAAYMWVLIPEVITYAEYTTGRRIAGIVNALTGMFLKLGLLLGGVIPGWVLAWTHYETSGEASPLPNDSHAWFMTMIIYALGGMALMAFCFWQSKERVVMDDSTTKEVRARDLWHEFATNRPLRVVCYFFAAILTLAPVGNAAGTYFMNGLHLQQPLAQEGIRWLVCVIPAILLIVAMYVISKYELTDERVEEMNRAISEAR